MGRKSKLTSEITKQISYCLEQGLTLSAASGKLGLSPSTVSKWFEQGKREDNKSSAYYKFWEAVEIARSRYESKLWESLQQPEKVTKIKTKKDKLGTVLEVEETIEEKINHSDAIWELRTKYGYKDSDRKLETFQRKLMKSLDKHLSPEQITKVLEDLCFDFDIEL
jgi:IS30 family transposase